MGRFVGGLFGALAGALIVTGAARAAPEAASDAEVLVARTRLEDAARTEDWRSMAAAVDVLRRKLGDRGLGARVRLFEARARLRLGDVAAATGTLEALLAERPDHIEALPLLARVRAAGGDVDRAKDLLVLAARAGRPVLADLRADARGAPVSAGGPLRAGLLAPLLGDPAFVLRVMTATREAAPAANLRDPFRRPRPCGPGVVIDGPPAAETELARAERELLACLVRVEGLARAHDPDAAPLTTAWAELRALLVSWERLGPPVERVEEVWARVEALSADGDRLRLQRLVARGNDLLRRMTAALDDERPADALALLGEVGGLLERLRAQPREAFRRTADAFEARADALARRARTLVRIAALSLRVTGVVLAPPGEPARAIVDDRIVSEGDAAPGPDGEPLYDVRVLAITSRAVRFRLDEVEFVRALVSLRP